MGISIENPCSEDWSKMTATDKGAFCQSCSKEVIDFTGRAAPEIRSLLAESMKKDKNVCGKITPVQMDVINSDYLKWQTNQESFRAVWIVSMIAVFGLTLFSCQNSASKEIVNQISVQATEMIDQESIAIETVDTVAPENVVALPVTNEIEINESTGGPIMISPVADFPETTWLTTIPECVITLGFMTTAIFGDFGPSGPSEEEIKFKRYLEEYNHISPYDKFSVEEAKPNFHFSEVNTLTSNRLSDVVAPGDPEFDAQILPIPIDLTSRLYLSLSEATEVTIRITNQAGVALTKLERLLFSMGEHEVDL
ncbi:MAG: hypothetical protein ACI837_000132, partial [Crocinitomicaceae bacterium]